MHIVLVLLDIIVACGLAEGIHYVHVDDLCSSTAGGSLCLTGTPSLLGHKLLILDGCEELYQRGTQASSCLFMETSSHARSACVTSLLSEIGRAGSGMSELVTWITRLLAVSAEVQIVVTATSLLTIDNMGDPLLGQLNSDCQLLLVVSNAYGFGSTWT
eukprot:4796298-Amphidinium_carterae.2